MIRKRLTKAAYEHNAEKLLSLTTLVDLVTYRNRTAVALRHRRHNRILRPWLAHLRVSGEYDLNAYIGDRTLRATEAQTSNKKRLLTNADESFNKRTADRTSFNKGEPPAESVSRRSEQ